MRSRRSLAEPGRSPRSMLARNTIAAGIAGLHNDLDSIPPFERWQSDELTDFHN